MTRAVQGLAAALALALALGAPASAADRSAKVLDNYYQPGFLVLTVGDRVTWRGEGNAPHTVTSYPGAPAAFDSSPNDDPAGRGPCSGNPPLVPEDDCMREGDSFSFRFTKAGTYNYVCKLHGTTSVEPDFNSADAQHQPCGMCGQIVVREASGPPPPVETTAPPRPSPTAIATGTPTTDATPDATSSPTPLVITSGPLATESGSPIAAPAPPDQDGGGGRAVLALVAILALGGAAYATWRRFLAGR